MSAFVKREILESLGWKEIIEETLPPGPGIAMSEVGELGPWFGVTDGKSINYGWSRTPGGCWGSAFDEYVGWEIAAMRLHSLLKEKTRG